MPLYLVQHGKNLSKDKDPEKGLSPEGKDESARMARVAGSYGVQVGKIMHSGKARARQTAEILGRELHPKNGVQQQEGLSPLDDVIAFARTIRTSDSLMVVGHLPFLSRLTSLLITGDPERPVFAFQNSGIVCLDQDLESQAWVIRWTLMPNIR